LAVQDAALLIEIRQSLDNSHGIYGSLGYIMTYVRMDSVDAIL